jgi:glycosyltransferase involved in cell wall biosynthesis
VSERAGGPETGARDSTGGERPEGVAPLASVVVPAHNEEAVIGRLLSTLAQGLDGATLEIVVACNGCTDRTADITRDHGAEVVEVDELSKIAALNAGDAAARAFPRFYVDADVILTGRAVRDVVTALAESGTLAGAPPIRVDDSGRSWAVRGFYAVWDALPYFEDAPIGSGVYAMSETGRARFDRFPDVIADDLFARNLFRRSERRVPETEPFVVQAPYSLRALTRRRIRIYAGNLQIAAHPELGRLPGGEEPSRSWWRPVVRRPSLLPAAVPYLAVNTVAKLQARRLVRGARPVAWGRDDTTRAARTVGSPS